MHANQQSRAHDMMNSPGGSIPVRSTAMRMGVVKGGQVSKPSNISVTASKRDDGANLQERNTPAWPRTSSSFHASARLASFPAAVQRLSPPCAAESGKTSQAVPPSAHRRCGPVRLVRGLGQQEFRERPDRERLIQRHGCRTPSAVRAMLAGDPAAVWSQDHRSRSRGSRDWDRAGHPPGPIRGRAMPEGRAARVSSA